MIPAGRRDRRPVAPDILCATCRSLEGLASAPYEIVGPIGAGGMGEVYRARDTRLERTVAVKVLPAHLSANPELRQRFEREARAISSLSHPNICALFNVGREGDTDYLVMELLDGESLADRLHRGPLPLPDFIRYSREIASALERAHQSGIIHRDLKPGNIVLTKAGAKLVDFGLARSRTATPAIDPETATVRVASLGPLTSEGSLVGTVPYMAPEQLKGKPADARSDIFAFGAVMYEMATGRRAFRGDNTASLIAAIMTSDPAFTGDARALTPTVERLISIALRKDPDERWQSAHDIGLLLADAMTTAAPAARRSPRTVTFVATAGVAALVAAAGTWLVTRPTATPAEVVYADLASSADSFVRLSPDGDQVIVGELKDDEVKVAVRSLRTGAVRTIDKLGPAHGVGFWARDGRSFYFSADGKLLRRTIGANTSVVIGEMPTLGGGCEDEDGSLLLAGEFGTPILAVAAGASAPMPATDEPRVHGESLAGSPVCLPKTDRLLYLAREAPGVRSSVYFAGAGAPRKHLLDADALVGVSRGHVLYVRNGVLHAQRLDIAAEQVLGPTLKVVDHVDYSAELAFAAVSLSDDGAMTYQDSAPEMVQFALYSLDGRRLRDIGEPIAAAREPVGLPKRCTLSHDRLRFACRSASATTGGNDIWVINVASGVGTPLTDDSAPKLWPTWDRDNRTVYYVADRHGFLDIYSREFDSAAPEREVARIRARQVAHLLARAREAVVAPRPRSHEGHPRDHEHGRDQGARKAGRAPPRCARTGPPVRRLPQRRPRAAKGLRRDLPRHRPPSDRLPTRRCPADLRPRQQPVLL